MMHDNPGATQSLRPRKTEPHIPICDLVMPLSLSACPYLSNGDPDSSFPVSWGCFNVEMLRTMWLSVGWKRQLK